MEWSQGIWEATRHHVLDCGRSGLTGHDSTDGTKMSDRLSKFGQWLGSCGENISYGMETAMAVLC